MARWVEFSSPVLHYALLAGIQSTVACALLFYRASTKKALVISLYTSSFKQIINMSSAKTEMTVISEEQTLILLLEAPLLESKISFLGQICRIVPTSLRINSFSPGSQVLQKIPSQWTYLISSEYMTSHLHAGSNYNLDLRFFHCIKIITAEYWQNGFLKSNTICN